MANKPQYLTGDKKAIRAFIDKFDVCDPFLTVETCALFATVRPIDCRLLEDASRGYYRPILLSLIPYPFPFGTGLPLRLRWRPLVRRHPVPRYS